MDTRQDSSLPFTFSSAEIAQKIITTVSAIAFDFDFNEPRVLLVKNKKPPRKSKEGKPGGVGLPTGQLESKEDMIEALKRETRDESGCSVKKVIGKFFLVNKLIKTDDGFVPNEIHVFLVEASDSLSKVREIEEIDASFEPWVPIKQAFEMSLAQNRGGSDRNANGIYFSHLQRLYRAIECMVFYPEELEDGEAIKKWLEPNRHLLKSAMVDIEKAGLLKRFLPPERQPTDEEIEASIEAGLRDEAETEAEMRLIK